ncbi:MAG: YraN family protein [Candidatus Dojkabacteria bacterium]|jgi:putative endonuclease|nr:YraN family protein [Candidatus Dojkabacteria bacterium]
MHRNKLGLSGEDFAVKYLSNKGYKIIGRNIQVGRGEIDIIAKHSEVIIFVEVKTRKSEDFEELSDTIGVDKEEALIESCEKYLCQNKLDTVDYRIDLVGVIIRNSNVVKIIHLEGIL